MDAAQIRGEDDAGGPVSPPSGRRRPGERPDLHHRASIGAHPSRRRGAAVGQFVYMAALAALTLTPIQILAPWRVLVRRLRDQPAASQTKTRIEQVLRGQQMHTAFQPIVDICSGNVMGVEALARFTAQPAAPPDLRFADAEIAQPDACQRGDVRARPRADCPSALRAGEYCLTVAVSSSRSRALERQRRSVVRTQGRPVTG